MNEVKKCPKCESANRKERRVRIAGTAGMFNPLEATAYICEKCGHIEFYKT